MKSGIVLKNLKIETILGLLPHEREKKQCIFIDLSLKYDFSKARKSDDISSTLCYAEIAKLLEKKTISLKSFLLESLVFSLTDLLFKFNKCIKKVEIVAKKPAAIENAEYAAVSLKTNRRDFYENE